jgi:hypothetical protein
LQGNVSPRRGPPQNGPTRSDQARHEPPRNDPPRNGPPFIGAPPGRPQPHGPQRPNASGGASRHPSGARAPDGQRDKERSIEVIARRPPMPR